MDAQRVVVLDDDSTGSQAACGVRVLLRPDLAAAEDWLGSGERALYVITNSRSLPEAQAVEVVKGFADGLAAMSRDRGLDLSFVLRGDSTLRGHVLAEIDCLATQGSVALFVPAFPEGGRVTIGGTHYLRRCDSLLPVAETEFARDPVFGYSDSYLPDWFAERAPGRAVTLVPLETVRAGPAAVSRVLVTAEAGTIVVADLESVTDAETIVAGLNAARAAGKSVVLRSAATAAALCAGVYSDRLLEMQPTRPARTLVVCGSHTEASTRQLDRLRDVTGVRGVELPASSKQSSLAEVGEAGQRLTEILGTDGIALLSTARERPTHLGNLLDGASVMARLTAVARAASSAAEACVVKGGITSVEVATTAFSAVEAVVQGQLEAGVSLWALPAGNGATVDYVVVPGNMGDADTLARAVGSVTTRWPLSARSS